MVQVPHLERQDGEHCDSSMPSITQSSVDTTGTGLHMHMNNILANNKSVEKPTFTATAV